MSKFSIDFFELSFLAEACIPPRPIARTMFWYDLINKHYYTMSAGERARLHDWITRSPQFDLANEDCLLFDRRFNPDHPYHVETDYNGEQKLHEAFKYKDKYYLEKDRFIDEAFIKNVVKIENL